MAKRASTPSDQKVYLEKVEKKPTYPKIEEYLWADYIEILCLVNLDGELSVQDIVDRLAEREADLKEGADDDIEEIQELATEDSESTARAAIDEVWHSRVADWFVLLRTRTSLYGKFYPFEVTTGEISLKKETFTNDQLNYIFLLYCAHLYLFNKSTQIKLAGYFELFSVEVLRNKLPPNAEVHLFGTSPANGSGLFNRKLSFLQKLDALASKLNEEVYSYMSDRAYPSSNRGDDGLDIAAWIPTGDNLPSKLVFFGQCACTLQWELKQASSSHDAWNSKITLANRVTNVVFIPFCYRDASGTWFKRASIQGSLLMDRGRMLSFIGTHKTGALSFVKKLIDAKEGVV